MGKIRGELEDLAFQYLEPEAYHGDPRSDRIASAHPTKSSSNEIRQTVEASCAAKAFRRASTAA